jgi:hypothetical protein
MSSAGPNAAPVATPTLRGRRVVVVHERGAAAAAALDIARELELHENAALTVVAVAPKAPSGCRCGGSAVEFNAFLRETVADDLDGARERLGRAGGRTDYVLLVDGEAPTLEEWIAAGGYDLILLPERRHLLRPAGHPAAGRLRGVTGAEVRVVPRRPT